MSPDDDHVYRAGLDGRDQLPNPLRVISFNPE